MVARVTAKKFVKLAPLGVMVGVATVETVIGAETVKLNAVLLVMLPAVAFTVTEKLPVGIDPVVLMLSIVEQVGVQELEENEAVAPEGRPETLNETA